MIQKISYLFSLLSLSAGLLLFTNTTVLAQDRQAQPDQLSTNASTTAQYTITFNATWSAQTHPITDFPTASAHFSGLVGAMHNDQIAFWQEGQLATEGIESMAETGSKTALLAEVDTAIAAGSADQRLSGGSIGLSPGDVSMGPVTVNQSHPQMTLVSMIAPSPDWFVGVNGLSLVDANGNWIDNLVVDLYPYDSGTDDGPDYTSSDADSVPPEPIANFTSVAPFSDQPIGTFTITRILQPSVEILSPNSGLIIAAGDAITLTYQVADLPANADHVHLYIDGVLEGPHFDLSAPILVTGLTEGTHQLLLDASEIDHTPLGISDTITIKVLPEGAAIPAQPTVFLPILMAR